MDAHQALYLLFGAHALPQNQGGVVLLAQRHLHCFGPVSAWHHNASVLQTSNLNSFLYKLQDGHFLTTNGDPIFTRPSAIVHTILGCNASSRTTAHLEPDPLLQPSRITAIA